MVGEAGSLSSSSEQDRTARYALILAALCIAAYTPSLFGSFVYDDVRFVEENAAIRSLSPGSVLSFFTDPETVAPVGWKGIYRPLRTLDFAVDQAVSGGAPWFFHLHNVLYHACGAVLVMLLLRELFRGKPWADRGAFLGAALFAVHPVHTEAVAWITSRGDVMVLVWFLLALLLYLKGHRALTAVLLVIAMLAKESAVVFVGVALVVDLYRGERLRLKWYGLYAGLALAYTMLWKSMMPSPELMPGHLARWWGGGYLANLLTMSQGFLLYLYRLVLPVDLLIDYHVPAIDHLTVGSATSIVILVAVVVAAIRGGPRSRLALAFFAITLFPMSNLLIRIGIPTAERFLYLPAVGLSILVAPWLTRTRLVHAIFGCFFLLTFARSFVWQDIDSLWAATNARAATPRGLSHLVATELKAAHDLKAKMKAAPMTQQMEYVKEMRAHAEAAVRAADRLIDLYEDEIRMPPALIGSGALSMKSNALMLLGRPQEALEAADQALKVSSDRDQLAPAAWYNAALACQALGKFADAAMNLEEARKAGYTEGGDLTPAIAALWNRAAAQAEAAGRRSLALDLYRRSWAALPDRARNAEAAEGLARLAR